MTGRIEALLAEKSIELPKAAAPVANYVPFVLSGNLLFVSGQIPSRPDGARVTGRVGKDITAAEAQEAARLCGLSLLAQAQAALGTLDHIARVVKLGVFVSCVDGFADQPYVANGASDLMVEVFGDAGRHARFAVGTNSLPLNVPVEVDAVFEIA